MQTKYFEYIQEIARLGSITKAAEHLHISQQALSEMLRLMEDELGFKIFLRSYKGVTPTVDGIAFLRDLNSIMLIMHNWKLMAERKKSYDKTKIYLQYVLSELVLHEAFQNISAYNVEWETISVSDIFTRIVREKNNCLTIMMARVDSNAYHYVNEYLPQYGCKVLPISSGKMCVAIHKDNPLALKEILEFKDLSGKQLIAHKKFSRTDIVKTIIDITENVAYEVPETIDVLALLSNDKERYFSYLPEEIIHCNKTFINGDVIIRHLKEETEEVIYYLIYYEEYIKENCLLIDKIVESFRVLKNG